MIKKLINNFKNIQQVLWLYSPIMLRANSIFNKLYKSTPGYALSHQERRRLNLKDPEFIYGEIIFSTYAKLLAVVQPTQSDVFYDMGAGAGKAVIATALICSLQKLVGIELLPALHDESLRCLSKLKAGYPAKAQNISFLCANFLETDISDATLVFINASAFMPGFWQQVITKLTEVKIGCRIIVVSKSLPLMQYRLLKTGTYLMGWGDAGVNIYIKETA